MYFPTVGATQALGAAPMQLQARPQDGQEPQCSMPVSMPNNNQFAFYRSPYDNSVNPTNMLGYQNSVKHGFEPHFDHNGNQVGPGDELEADGATPKVWRPY